MAITKTNFINYIRCPRYAILEDIKADRLSKKLSLEEYLEEEKYEKINEIMSSMYEDGESTIDVVDEQLEVMLPYYNKVELLAGSLAPNYFSGTFKFSVDTLLQESFEFKLHDILYLCYVDIYNETDEAFNIIEVKATTSKKYLDLGVTKNKEKISIFKEGDDHIFYLLEDLNMESIMDKDDYIKCRNKLFDKYSNVGHYVYDLAVQRYIIENDLRRNGMEDKIPKIKYYLAVLNHEYIFDGTYIDNSPIYQKDSNGMDIIRYFDMTNITKELMPVINNDRIKIEEYINSKEISNCPIGEYCEKKKSHKCKYIPVCWKHIPSKNSIFNYLDNHFGFKKDGIKYTTFDLVNNGIINMLDLDDSYIERKKNLVQKECLKENKTYINLDKIKAGINKIEYPIYHLDFETFPCPLPRYKGEKCYTQSVFQYSLHVEKEPGICDKEKDHYGYLSIDNLDHRKELIESMINSIDLSKGTILVYNESFEKSRLKELASIFPQYKNELLRMREMVFDLMYIIKGNNKLYESLGFPYDEVGFNYYDSSMSGSFSIKKILPLFSNLTYQGMEVANGVDALVTYAKFPYMERLEYQNKYQKLIEYCKQDTWAMVEILQGLKKL